MCKTYRASLILTTDLKISVPDQFLQPKPINGTSDRKRWGAYNRVRGMMEVVNFLADRLGDDAAGTLVSLLHQRLMFPHHDKHTQG